MENEELLVYLDSPARESSFSSPKLPFSGWLIVSGRKDSTAHLSVEVLLEEHHSERSVLRAGLILAGSAVGSSLELGTFEGERISSREPEFRESEASLYFFELSPSKQDVRPPGELVGGEVFSFRGVFDVSALLPKEGNSSKLFSLSISCSLGKARSLSNQVTFYLQTPGFAKQSFGGFLYPKEGPLCSDLLLLDGWALRADEDIASVAIEINGVDFGPALFGLPSPSQASTLPDIPGSEACRFSAVMLWSEAAEALGFEGKGDIVLNSLAKVRYSSGDEHLLHAPAIHWSPRTLSPGESPFGRIESISQTTRGTIKVEGYTINSGAGNEILEVHQSKGEGIVFEQTGGPGQELCRFFRSDLQNRFPTISQVYPFGFSFELNPLSLGRCPGQVSIVVRETLSNTSSELAPRSMASVLTECIFERSQERSPLESAVHQARKVGSNLREYVGQRKRTARKQLEISPKNVGSNGKSLLFVSHNLAAFEGAPKVLFRVVQAIRECFSPDTDLHLVAAHDGELRERYRALGVEVRVIPQLGLSGYSVERYREGLAELLRYSTEISPALVFCNVIDSFPGVDAARRLGLPVLWTLHESIDPRTCFPELPYEVRLQVMDHLRQASGLIFVAEASARMFSPLVSEEKRKVIPNGIDLERIDKQKSSQTRAHARSLLGISPDCFVVSCIGTTTRRKGQDVLLRAVSELIPRLSEIGQRDLRVFIVGAREISFLSLLRDIIKELGLEGCVELVAETTEVSRYYIVSDVIVIPSREESAPLVSLEAFAYGVPLVSTDVYGLAEQLSDESDALVVPVEDPQAITRAILRIFLDRDLSTRLAVNGRRKVESVFCSDKMLKQYWSEISNRL